MRAFIVGGLIGGLAVVPALAATPNGSWPTYAHDAKREARADGVGEMKNPTIAWQLALGGNIGPGQSQITDVDGDGRPDLVFVEAGRVTVLAAGGTAMWKGSLIGATTVLGAWDLNGLGYRQVVVQTSSDVWILDGKTGSELGGFPTIAPVSAQFIAPILTLTSSRGTTLGYKFTGGPLPTKSLWSVPSQNATNLVVGDLDGDGNAEFIRPLDDGFDVLDPLTGNVKFGGPVSLGDAAYYYDVVVANVDSNVGDEIVAVDHSYYYSPTSGIHVLSALGGTLHELWSHVNAATEALTTDVQMVAGTVCDLDGDGLLELVYSVWDNGEQTWNTHIDDASSGADITVLPNELVAGIGDIDGDGKSEIVTRSAPLANLTPVRSTVTAFDFDARDQPPTQKSWAISQGHLLSTTALRPDTQRTTFAATAIDDFDTQDAGLEMLIGRDALDRGEDTELDVIGASGNALATTSVDAHVDLQLGWFGDRASSNTSIADIITFEATGAVRVRTSALAQASAMTAGTYANWISVTPFTNGNNIVLFADGARAIRWLDGTTLNGAGQPKQVFAIPGAVSAVTSALYGYGLDPVFYIPGSSPLLVTQEQGETVVTLVAHDVSGVEVWRTVLAPGTWVHPPGAYVTDLTGDGNPDLLLNLVNINGLASFAIFDGVNGSLVRSTPLASIATNADEFLHGALADVDNDSQLDLVGPISSCGIAAIDLFSDPMTMKWLLPYSSNPMVNGTVAAASYNEAQDLGLFRVGGDNGFGPYARVNLSGNLVAQYDSGVQPIANSDPNYAAFVKRAPTSNAFDIVSVGSSDVALSRVVRIDGAAMTADWTVYASAGAVTTTTPAVRYRLHDPLAMDVDGDGTEEVVFGSDDGYVYAIHAFDGTLAFSVNLDAPVAHIIAANIDLDTPLELVASLSDGRLVALDEPGKYLVNPTPTDAGTDGNGDADASADGGSISCPTPPPSSCECSYLGKPTKGPTLLAMFVGALLALRRRRRSIN